MSRTPTLVALATGTALIAAVGLASSTASAAPDADSFAGATVYTGAAFTAHVDTTGATTETGEPISVSDTATRQSTVWLRWTAPADATVTLQSAGGAKTGVAVYTGSSISTVDEVVIGATSAEFDATAGTAYSIQVSAVGTPDAVATGPVDVTLSSAPAAAVKADDGEPDFDDAPVFTAAAPNDNFASAATLSGARPFDFMSNIDATTQSGEPTTISGSTSFFNTLWYKWKAPQSGNISVKASGESTSYDTAVAVYSGSKLTNLTRLGVNDDANGERNAFLAPIKVSKGKTYYIQAGLTGYTGSGPISTPTTTAVEIVGIYTPPSNDNFTSAVTVKGTDWVAKGTTIGATVEPTFENVSNAQFPASVVQASVWWKWKPAAAGRFTASTEGSTGDTSLTIVTRSDTTGLTFGTFSDDYDNHVYAQINDYVVQAGETYYFRVGVVGGQLPTTGAVILDVDATLGGPVISSIAPSSGKAGTKVTITGERLGSISGVVVGSVNVPTVTIVNSKKITFIAPTGVPKGKKPVIVYNIEGQASNGVNPKTFTYK